MSRKQDARARGFTLVEVMVALVLLSVVVGGLFSTMTVIGHAQATSALVDVAQAGARAGFEIIARDLRMACAGTTDGTVFAATGSPSVQPTLTITDSAGAPDRIDLVLLDPTAQTIVTSSYGQGSTSLGVASSSGFNVGDQVIVTDFAGALLVTVTAVNGGASPSLTTAAPSNTLPRTWPIGSWAFRAKPVSYYVDTTTYGAASPMLMFDPDGPGPQPGQPLAEGVEDLQVALGVDANNDGVITQVGASAGDDEWTFNVAGETAPASYAQLKSVRFTVVVRTTTAFGGTLGQRPAAEDRPAASAADAYPRRVLESEVSVRNFNL